jgi:hypothetical protein
VCKSVEVCYVLKCVMCGCVEVLNCVNVLKCVDVLKCGCVEVR